VTDSARQAPLPAIPLLIFAAIDLVLALLLLVAGGFSIQFLVVGAIGLALGGIGLWSVFSKAALDQVRTGDAEPRPLPRMLRPRRRERSRR
jgi:hypothetical protein